MNQGRKRIPIPLDRRLHDARLHLLPAICLVGVIVGIVFLWRYYVAAPNMAGQAEPVVAHVSSYKPGVLAEVSASRFQKVTEGDVVGQALGTDPRILASTLRDRAQLTIAELNLELAETELRRVTSLYENQIVAQRVLEQAQASKDRADTEVRELRRLVQNAEQALKNLQFTNAPELNRIADPLTAAIHVQNPKETDRR